VTPNAVAIDARGDLLVTDGGPPRVPVELPGTVPDGVAVDERGALWIACYEPSQVLVVEPGGEVRVAAHDPDAHLLCHPTNAAFRGTTLITANLGRWHLTELDAGRAGIPLPAGGFSA
jgi:gluconolactonase